MPEIVEIFELVKISEMAEKLLVVDRSVDMFKIIQIFEVNEIM